MRAHRAAEFEVNGATILDHVRQDHHFGVARNREGPRDHVNLQ